MQTGQGAAMPNPSQIDELIAAADAAGGDDERTDVVNRLAAWGIEPLDALPGIPFDPAVHRAVAALPATSTAQENTIAHTVRPGWRRHGRMLRYVEVTVQVPPPRSSLLQQPPPPSPWSARHP